MPARNVYAERRRAAASSGGSGGGSWASLFTGGGGNSTGFVPTGDVAADYDRLLAERAATAAENGTLLPDLRPSDEQTKEEVQAQLQRLLLSPDRAAREEGKRLIAQMIAPGLSEGIAKEKSNSIGIKALKVAAPVLEVIGRPANATQELIQAAVQDTGADKLFSGEWRLNEDEKATQLSSAAESGVKSEESKRLLGAGSEGSGGYSDALRALRGEERWDPTSLSYTENLSYQNALGSDDSFNTGALGKVTDVANFTGTAALDPLNFIGGGSATSARLVAKEAAEILGRDTARRLAPALAKELGQETAEGLSKEVIEQGILKVGARKALTEADQAAVLASRTAVAEASGTALRGDRLGTRAVRGLTGKGTRTGAERVAETALEGALRYDRGGLRVGRSLTPEAVRSPLRGALRNTRTEVGSKYAADALARGTERLALAKEADAARATAKSDDFLAEAAAVATGGGTAADGTALVAKAEGAKNTAAKALAEAEKIRSGAYSTQELMDMGAGNILAPVAETSARGLAGGTTGKVQAKAAELFRPRAAIRASESLRTGTDELVNIARTQGAGETKQVAQEGARILNTALKDTKAVTPELERATLRAMDIGGDMDALLASATPEQLPYIKGMADLRKLTYETNVGERLAAVSKLRKQDEYIPRYVADKKMAEVLDKASRMYPDEVAFQAYSTAKNAAGQAGRLSRRTFMPNATLEEVNAALAKRLVDAGLIDEGVDVLEMSLSKIQARRFNEMLPALQLKKQVAKMAKTVKGSLGEDLIKIVQPGEKDLKKAATKNFVPIPLGEAGIVYAHPDLAPEITQYVELTIKPNAVGDFGKFMDGWNRLWKSYATVPVITGTGFHVKNTIGNMFNNYLAGVHPQAYAEALGLQKDIIFAKARHPELPVPEALLESGVPEAQVNKVRAALENQVLEEGFFNTDLSARAELAIEGKKSVGQRALAKVDIRNPDEMFGVPTGRKIGEHIEDNARLAHFLSKLDDTGDAVAAAQSVRKYLFDYSDLTPFEQKVMKRAHAFYTFTRKNTPLQFAEIARNPAKFNRMNLAKNMVLGNNGDGEGAPEFMSEIGTPLGKAQSGWLSGNQNQVIGGIETPFDAAMRTADPLTFLLPESVRGKKSGQEVAQDLAGNFSGGPVELAKAFADYSTGSSTFSGSDMKTPDGAYRMNPALRLSQAIMPNISKGARLFGVSAAGPPSDSQRLRVIKAMTGIQAKEVTPKMRAIAADNNLQTVEDVIRALKDEGVAVPDQSDLPLLYLTPRMRRLYNKYPNKAELQEALDKAGLKPTKEQAAVMGLGEL